MTDNDQLEANDYPYGRSDYGYKEVGSELKKDKDGAYIIPVGKTVWSCTDSKNKIRMYLYGPKEPWYKRLFNWIRR